jgi:hypothetical protein
MTIEYCCFTVVFKTFLTTPPPPPPIFKLRIENPRIFKKTPESLNLESKTPRIFKLGMEKQPNL